MRHITLPTLVLALFLLGGAFHGMSQNMSINSNGAKPDSSAMLDVQSTTQGLLMPRMTQAQRDAISNPANGLLIYQTDGTTGLFRFDSVGGSWNLLPDSIQVSLMADNLGDHLMDTNLITNGRWISGDGDDEGVFVTATGEIGINTSTPTTTMLVFDTTQSRLRITSQDTTWTGLEIRNSVSDYRIYTDRFKRLLVRDHVASPNVTRLAIDSVGNVGIGTVDPLVDLHVVNDAFPYSGALGNDGLHLINAVSGGGGAGSRNRIASWYEQRSLAMFSSENGGYANGQLNTWDYSVLNNDSMPLVLQGWGGNVGIGQLIPEARLHVMDSMKIEDDGNGRIVAIFGNGEIEAASDQTLYLNRFGNNNVSLAYGGGRVGVNTLPTADFHALVDTFRIETPNNFSGTRLDLYGKRHNAGSPHSMVDFRNIDSSDGNTEYSAARIESTNPGGSDDGDLRFYTTDNLASSLAMIIDQVGDVGIGTNSPNAKLDVNTDGSLLGGARLTGTTAATVGPTLYFDGASRDYAIYASNSSAGAGTDKLVFRDYSGAADRMVITSGGDVGIGTTNPSGQFHIRGATGDNVDVYIESQGAAIPARLHLGTASQDWRIGNNNNDNLAIRDMTGGTTFLTLENATGQLGIGTISPAVKLDVVGNVQIPAANDYTYAAAKTHYIGVAASALNEEGGNSFSNLSASGNSYHFSLGIAGTVYRASAPIYLPDSAVITNLTAYVLDNDVTYTATVQLIRQPYGNTGSIGTPFSATSSSNSAAIQTVSDAGTLVVDNSANMYKIRFDGRGANGNIRYYGARITYTVLKAD